MDGLVNFLELFEVFIGDLHTIFKVNQSHHTLFILRYFDDLLVESEFRVIIWGRQCSHCELESTCHVGGAWQKVNVAIRRALEDVSLKDLIRTNSPTPQFRFAGLPVMVEKKRT